MVILEAMCAGCEIITTNTTGGAEILENAGLLVSLNDNNDLKSKINLLINVPEKIKFFRSQILFQAKKYNWLIIIEKYIKLL